MLYTSLLPLYQESKITGKYFALLNFFREIQRMLKYLELMDLQAAFLNESGKSSLQELEYYEYP